MRKNWELVLVPDVEKEETEVQLNSLLQDLFI